MIDRNRALDALAQFSEHPPTGRPSLDQVAERARSRRTRVRRRRLAGVAMATMIVAAGLVATIDASPERDAAVTVVGRSTTSEPSAGPSLNATAEPNSDLVDGESVRLVLQDDPEGELIAQQCTSEVSSLATAPEHCAQTEHYLRSPAGSPGMQFVVARTVATSDRTVDCAEREGRCVILVRSVVDQDRTWTASLSFRAEIAAVSPQLTVGSEPLVNGETTTLVGTGFPVGDQLMLVECAGPTSASPCDQARAATTTVGSDGTFEAPFIVSSELLANDGWVPCAPCHIQAFGNRAPHTSSDVFAVAPSGDPVRPEVSILEQPPYAPGESVNLRGRGFQALARDVTIGVCEAGSAGVPPQCAYPTAGLNLRVEVDGTFHVAEYPLPAGIQGACTRLEEECVLGWYPNEGGPPAFSTPLATDG